MSTSLAGVVPLATLGIIDTHIHQWDPFTTPREASRLAGIYRRVPWLVDRLLPLLADQGSRQLVITPAQVGRPYLPATFAADAAAVLDAVGVPVTSVIHVEAGWHGPDPAGETAWVHALPFGADGAPGLAAIVAAADPRAADFAAVLDRHAATSDRFRGIRAIGAWHPDKGVKSWTEDEGLYRSPAFLDGFAALAERGLTFDAWVYSHQLPDVAVLARAYPSTTIVLDHYATPVGLLGPLGRRTGRTAAERADLLRRWRDLIAEVADCPNVVSKQSGIAFPPLGLQTPGVTRDDLAAMVAPLIEHAADVFGPDRLLFGSNFPMDKAITDYGTVVGVVADVLAPRGPDVLAKTFRGNAEKVYRLGSDDPARR